MDNFNLKKYLGENKLLKENLSMEDVSDHALNTKISYYAEKLIDMVTPGDEEGVQGLIDYLQDNPEEMPEGWDVPFIDEYYDDILDQAYALDMEGVRKKIDYTLGGGQERHGIEEDDKDESDVKRIINILKQANLDGETLQYILEELGMDEQMWKQLNVTYGNPVTFSDIREDDEFDDPADRPAHEFDSFASADIEEANEDPNQKKYTEEEWKYELDLNAKMAARLIAHQAMGNADAVWEDLVADLVAMQKQSRIPGNIEFFKEWIESQETNGLPNSSSGSFFTGLTDIDGLLSAMNFEEELEFDGESDEDLYLYTDEEYDKAVAYHNARLNQEVPDMFKY